MRDYFRSRSTMQLPSTEYNFRQHLLHKNTSIIAFSINELKKGNIFEIFWSILEQKSTISGNRNQNSVDRKIILNF